MSTESLKLWKDRAEMAKRQAKLSKKLLIVSKAQEANIKKELEAS